MRGLASAVLDDLTLAVFKGHSPPGTGGTAGLGYEVSEAATLAEGVLFCRCGYDMFHFVSHY